MAHSILVVDDEDTVRRWIVEILQLHGFQVIETGFAEEALSIVQNAVTPVDMAIVDMVMPGTSGLDFGAAVERQHPEMKLLYVSGNVDSIAVDVIHRQAPQWLLLKPFSEGQLLEHVNRLLNLPSGEPGREPAA